MAVEGFLVMVVDGYLLFYSNAFTMELPLCPSHLLFLS